jgi:hypothetical protein
MVWVVAHHIKGITTLDLYVPINREVKNGYIKVYH